jgi:hypothetical protein
MWQESRIRSEYTANQVLAHRPPTYTPRILFRTPRANPVSRGWMPAVVTLIGMVGMGVMLAWRG